MRKSFWSMRLGTSMLGVMIVALILAWGLQLGESRRLRVALAVAEARASRAEAEAEWGRATAVWSADAATNTWGLVWKHQNDYRRWMDHVRDENLDRDRGGPAVGVGKP